MTQEQITRLVEALEAALRGCCAGPSSGAEKEAPAPGGQAGTESCCGTKSGEPHIRVVKMGAGGAAGTGCVCICIDDKGDSA